MRFINLKVHQKTKKQKNEQGQVLGLQSATHAKFHDMKEPINVLLGIEENTELWFGFANGDIGILKLETKTLPKRWRAHPGGVLSLEMGTNTVWSGEHYVLDHYPS